MNEVDISPILNEVVNIVVVLVAAAGIYLSRKLADVLNLRRDSYMANALQYALDNATTYVLNAVNELAEEHKTITVSHPSVASALNYVNSVVPDALDHFGIDDDGILMRLEARLGFDINHDGKIGDAPQT